MKHMHYGVVGVNVNDDQVDQYLSSGFTECDGEHNAPYVGAVSNDDVTAPEKKPVGQETEGVKPRSLRGGSRSRKDETTKDE